MGFNVTHTLAHDHEGRLASLSQTVGHLTRNASAAYDANGRLTALTYPAGFTISYHYNAEGQITAIQRGTQTLATYSYDTAGRLISRALANGVTTAYTYGTMSRLVQIAVGGPGGALWAHRYGFNAAGERIFTLEGSTGTTGDAYQLDATGQLTGVKYGATGADAGYASAVNPAAWTTWTYDETGNRIAETGDQGNASYTANSVSQYTAVSGMGTLAYSARGDLAQMGDWAFTYDAFGNLLRAHNGQTNTLAKYWRDAFGHRAVKDVDGTKTVFFNFGHWPIEAYDLETGGSSSTVYEPGIDRPLCELNADGSVRFFYHQDWLGNVVALTDPSGAIHQRFRYEVWGPPSGYNASGEPIEPDDYATRFLFTAREFDPETGLYHYRARAYSPALGRFLQFDPIDFDAGDVNLLRYVSNMPTELVDPTGEAAPAAIGAAAVVQAAAFGAAGGIAGHLLEDLIDGTPSCFEDYMVSGIAGALGGMAGLVAGGGAASAIAGGAAAAIARGAANRGADK